MKAKKKKILSSSLGVLLILIFINNLNLLRIYKQPLGSQGFSHQLLSVLYRSLQTLPIILIENIFHSIVLYKIVKKIKNLV